MLLSIALIGVGLGLGWWLYGHKPRATAEAHDPLVTAAPKLLAALANRLGFDELYAATFGRLNALLAAVAAGLDRWVFGVLIKFLGQFSLFSGSINREIDEDGLNGGFDLVSASVRGTGQRYSRAQTGSTHGYLRVLAVAFIILAFVVAFGGAQ
jgi:NADH-quinone oxidoreductase subunit L